VSFIQAYRADPYAAQAYEQQWTIFRPPAYGSTGLASGQLCANSYLATHCSFLIFFLLIVKKCAVCMRVKRSSFRISLST
uniref:Uncharacterized protein n=1 Tax=Parascaris equorum TaxID=6256 RepID=A0A914S5J7_PAREQ